MNPLTHWPEPDEERQLLTQLHTGTPTAREELAGRYLELLTHQLRHKFPRVGDLCDEAAERAILNFLDAPHRFDPTRGGLGAYLRMAAHGDLLNLLEHKRRAARGIPLDSVAELADHRNMKREDDELSWTDPRLAAELAVFTADERAALELMRDGVRNTTAFAARLGLAHLPAKEQAVVVKRIKDRVKTRLVRAVEDLR